MTLTLKEEKLALLEETVNHFNLRNRSTRAAGRCIYGGVGCAIGRKIQDKNLCNELDNAPMTGVSAIFDRLPEDLQKFGKPFLAQLQDLHDDIDFWTRSGISYKGLKRVALMKINISNDSI